MLFLVPLLAKRRWKASMACCAGFLAGLGPYLVWSRLRFGGFFLTLHKGWTNVEGKESVFFYLRNSGAIFTPVALFGLTIAAVFSVWRFFGPSRPQPRLLNSFGFQPASVGLKALLWLWLLADFLFLSGMTHKEPRYVLPLALHSCCSPASASRSSVLPKAERFGLRERCSSLRFCRLPSFPHESVSAAPSLITEIRRRWSHHSSLSPNSARRRSFT